MQEDDLLTLLAEQEAGPRPCPHVFSVGPRGDGQGWAWQMDPTKEFYLEMVHSNPGCLRPAAPGKVTRQAPTMGWSRKLQKDVPL